MKKISTFILAMMLAVSTAISAGAAESVSYTHLTLPTKLEV